MGQWALSFYLNPGVALAFPELWDVSRHTFLILINMQSCPFSVSFFLLLLNLFFFPHHQWFSALYMLMMAPGARTWFRIVLLSQTRIQWYTLLQHQLQHSFLPPCVSFSFTGKPASPYHALFCYTRFKEQSNDRDECLVRVQRKNNLGNLSSTFQSKSRVLKQTNKTKPNKTTNFFFLITKESMSWVPKKIKRMFFTMEDFSFRNVKIIQISTLGSLLCKSMPCHHLRRREESHFWWREGSNLCCQFSCWDPAGCQREWTASRAIAYHSCKLPPVFVQCEPRTLGLLQPFLSTTRSLPALFTAGRDEQWHSRSCNPVLAQRALQTLAVQTGELLLPWGAVAKAQKSWLSCATKTWVSLPLKISEISKTHELGAFPCLGNDQTSSHIQLPLSLEISCCPFPRSRSSLFFRAAAPAPQSCWAQQ